MADRHKTPTLTLRMPDGERSALEDYARRHGITRHEAILRAIRELLARDADGQR